MLANITKITVLLFLSPFFNDIVFGRDLKTPKSSKAPTLKSSTKAPSLKSSSTVKSTKSPTLKSSSKAPSAKSTKKSSVTSVAAAGSAGGVAAVVDECTADVFTSIGGVDLDGLVEDSEIGTLSGLVWTNWKASATPTTDILGVLVLPMAAVPTSTTSTIESSISCGTFSLERIDMVGESAINPLTVNGYDNGGTLIVTKVLTLTNTYVRYDLREFAEVAKIDFVFSAAGEAGFEDWRFR